MRRAAEALPRWSYRWRYGLVLGAFALSAAGAIALIGVPGLWTPMPLETDALDYLPKGTAIFCATLVNAGGFLALALSDLPPVRQFGVLTSSAFVVSAVADFTALPAALWLLLGGRPSPDYSRRPPDLIRE